MMIAMFSALSLWGCQGTHELPRPELGPPPDTATVVEQIALFLQPCEGPGELPFELDGATELVAVHLALPAGALLTLEAVDEPSLETAIYLWLANKPDDWIPKALNITRDGGVGYQPKLSLKVPGPAGAPRQLLVALVSVEGQAVGRGRLLVSATQCEEKQSPDKCEALACDDEIGCTKDGCTPEQGCEFEPIDALCDDQDPCTVDWCDLKQGCQHKPNPDCQEAACLAPDGSEVGPEKQWKGEGCVTSCTCDPDTEELSCELPPKQCKKAAECKPPQPCLIPNCQCGCGGPCECTFIDDPECGKCKKDCNDSNPCTYDLCDPVDGCLWKKVPDGSACGVCGVCLEGSCYQAGKAACGEDSSPCDDGNPCTKDSCYCGGPCSAECECVHLKIKECKK